MERKIADSMMKNDSFFVSKQQDHQDTNRIEGQLLLADRLFHSMMEGILITDTNGVITFINPAFTKISGYGIEVIGLTPRILQSGKQSKSFYRQMWQSIEQEGQWQGEMWNKNKNGEIYIQWTTITRITDDFGKPIYFAAVLTDITQRKKAEQQLHDDLLLAREVQKGALSKPINNEFIHIDGAYLPSEMLGGDMYAWYKIDDDRYAIFLMDVMGHGVASALVCMSVRSLLRGIITNLVAPEKVMKELNHHVITLFHSEDSLHMKNYYLTCIYTVIDIKENRITYASAGHPPGFLIDQDGHISELDAGTVPLGMLSDIDVEIGIQEYTGMSKLVLYTDGVIEEENKSTRAGIDKLKMILSKNRNLEVKGLLNRTITTLLEQMDSMKFQDDATLIAVNIKE